MSKKALFAAIAVVLVTSLCAAYLPSFAIAATTGTCGDNLIWTYDSDTYTLTISGTGMMTNYDSYAHVPWYQMTIKNLVIESGVTSIGDYAFEKSSSYTHYEFTTVVLPEKLATIGKGAFEYCPYLTEITLPKTLVTLGASAFYGCSSLKSIAIPDRVTTLSGTVFSNCTALTSVTLPSHLTSIGNGAFYNCKALPELHIPETVKSIGTSAFNGCAALTEINLPADLTTISNLTFASCSSLSTITFPQALTTIGDRAFADCSNLVELTIPASVTTIGANAFTNGINILDITYGGAAPTIAEDAFTNVYADVHYPASATSWNADTMLNYGGDLYYEPYMDPASLIPELKLAYPSLAFEGAVNYNVYFTATNASNFPVKDMGLILFDSMRTDGTMDDAIEVIPGVQFNEASGVYMAHTNGIPAKNLGDTIYFKVYAKMADGSYVYSNAGGYNAVAYAKTILNGDYDQDLKDLATELMNYGAAAQQYFDYKLDAPMNGFITE